VGGGIIGLWLSAILNDAGYQTLLFESNSLGSGQTLCAQGIIHGGTKYALTGKLTGSSEAIRAMPGRWQSHLHSELRPDLGEVTVNTRYQWMWSAEGVGAKVAGFLASKVMSSRVTRVGPDQLPDILSGKTVYQLQEPVLDVASLMQVLAEHSRGRVYQARATDIIESAEGLQVMLKSADHSAVLQAGVVILTAGEGNEGLTTAGMQRRALHMAMVKGDLPRLCTHIIEAGANPRLTITSHESKTGEVVWYIGGQLAEKGVERSRDEQIGCAKKEVRALFEGIDWDAMQWSTLKINRAEGRQAGEGRPDEPVIAQQGNRIAVWPTKLAFAPLVADDILGRLENMQLESNINREIDPGFGPAEVGDYPWDRTEWS